MKVFCLFEQSGTFKNEFKKLGFDAYDYDIVKTPFVDFSLDLMNEIRWAYTEQSSIFDGINKNDLVFAFYPCIRFTDSAHLLFTGHSNSMKNWDDLKKLEYDIKLHNELHELYLNFVRLVSLAYRKGFKLIIENPYSKYHYLKYYFCIEPSVIDGDRTKMGDYFMKPTQYWFINIKPKNNFVLDPLVYHEQYKVQKTWGINRSIISSDYANRFIKQYIL